MPCPIARLRKHRRFGVTKLDQHRTRRVFGEPAGDDHGAKFVVEATVISFGHEANPRRVAVGRSDPAWLAQIRSGARAISNVSPDTTACTGPSNSALASLITSSREVHGGMCVSSSS